MAPGDHVWVSDPHPPNIMTHFVRLATVVAAIAVVLPVPSASAQGRPPNAIAPGALTLVKAKPSAAGMSESLVRRVDSVIKAGIADHATPGATLAVARRGKLLMLKGYGHTDWAPGAPAATDSTMYDMASLTKVVATTTASMILEEEGKLNIDRTVASYLPEYDVPDKRGITVRMLLTHASGIKSNFPLWKDAKGREQYFKGMVAFPLVREPGSAVEYTDWNMVLMQFIVETHHWPDARSVRAGARVRTARDARHAVSAAGIAEAADCADGDGGVPGRPGMGHRP